MTDEEFFVFAKAFDATFMFVLFYILFACI
jgi:hypothetical protein